MKPGKNPLRLKLMENRLLITTRNQQHVQKALANLTDMIQLEVMILAAYIFDATDLIRYRFITCT